MTLGWSCFCCVHCFKELVYIAFSRVYSKAKGTSIQHAITHSVAFSAGCGLRGIQQGKGKTEVQKEVFDDKTSKLKTIEDDEIRFVSEHLVVPELKPSDFKQKVGLNSSVMANCLYILANAAVLGLIAESSGSSTTIVDL